MRRLRQVEAVVMAPYTGSRDQKKRYQIIIEEAKARGDIETQEKYEDMLRQIGDDEIRFLDMENSLFSKRKNLGKHIREYEVAEKIQKWLEEMMEGL